MKALHKALRKEDAIHLAVINNDIIRIPGVGAITWSWAANKSDWVLYQRTLHSPRTTNSGFDTTAVWRLKSLNTQL